MRNPIRWALWHLMVYTTVAIVSAMLFLVGAAFYAYVVVPFLSR